MNSENSHPTFPLVLADQVTAFDRGQFIGQQTKSKITWSLDTYEKMFALCDISWSKAIESSQPYLDACNKLSGQHIEELRGIAAGSGVDIESLWALNCRTEILPADFLSRAHALMEDEAGKGSGSSQFPNECTSFTIASDNTPVWLAQNWDWCGRQRQALCVVERHSVSGHVSTTVTEAGMLAKVGLNNLGFGITLNILRSHDDGRSAGVPVHILLRSLLDCQSVAEAIEHVHSLRYASSSNIMVADKSGAAASIELSPVGVKVIGENEHTICHTNHFIDDALAKKDIGRVGNQSTINRLTRARANVRSGMSFDNIKTLLCNTEDGLESICRFPDTRLPDIAQLETVTAIIMNLTEQTLSVSAAQPNLSAFKTYQLSTMETADATH